MEKERSGCPINMALEVFGDRWSLLIIRDIMFAGKRNFRDLLASDEKIASNILTDRLSRLEEEGIISKGKDPSHKQKITYSLTSKGIDLLPVLAEMGCWSLKHKDIDEKKFRKEKAFLKGGKELQKAIMKQLAKEHLK
jgi:DNA-binding HxlR family transcriptional regulator